MKDFYFKNFKKEVSQIQLPKKFTFPFYYEPHELCRIAVKEVQDYLETQTDWKHNFSSSQEIDSKVIGKMFGVLVVKNQQGKLGYLAAFSGKLAGTNNHKNFVPPVFDMLTQNSYFLEEEIILNDLNRQIENLEDSKEFQMLQKAYDEIIIESNTIISNFRKQMITAKAERKKRRNAAKSELTEKDYQALIDDLGKQSVALKYELRKLTEEQDKKTKIIFDQCNGYLKKINSLKEDRKTRSNALQHYLFKQYQFLNKNNEKKDLLDLFKFTAFETPPAGAGECAAPKLLQHAFLNNYELVAMAEFWWGDSPKSEIRKHKHFYPACQGKCKPILGHMLDGISMDENPLLTNPGIGKEVKIIFEDDSLLVVNKPEEFLSVPGKNIDDSVYLRMKQYLPNASGPLIVHRLDMSTSGIMLIAKSENIYKILQQQFIKRQVKKRYIAVLDGTPKKEEGFIDLPLRLDIDDRPRQLVCFEHGKSARTQWEIISQDEKQTRVYFYPITGRTHQLRVHAAHELGLNTPIIGDDLYGKKSKRLHLHAESITFNHPVSKMDMSFSVDPNF